MAHCQLPPILTHPRLEDLLQSMGEYGGIDFVTYPSREGWNERSVRDWYYVFEQPSPGFKEFLERWLLLGPLVTAAGIQNTHLYLADLADTRRGSHPLPLLIQRALDHANLASNRTPALREAVSIALRLHAELSNYDVKEKPTRPEILSRYENLVTFIKLRAPCDPRSPEVAMATSVALEIFSLALGSDFGRSETHYSAYRANMSPMWTSLAWKQLRDAGWCVSELTSHFDRLNTSCLDLLSSLLPPRQHETHHMIRIHRGEVATQNLSKESRTRSNLCTPFVCQYRQLNDDTYETQHADGCSRDPKLCTELKVDMDDLREILNSGKIPLVLSIDDTDDNETLTLIPADSEIKYVAISHVWSDGLGNLHQNALLKCQVQRISRLIRSLQDDLSDIVLFWLDTLCIPPDALGLDKEQGVALDLMRKTYEDAAAVLVLDSWLLNNRCSDKPHIETLLRIFASPWNSRLWTFQEGALANALIFQFSDGTYELDRRIEELYATADMITMFTFVKALKRRHHNLRFPRKYDDESIHRMLLAVTSALNHRSTSVTSDEALCLATVLGLKVSDIAKIKSKVPGVEHRLRMQEFWKMLPTIPEYLAFSPIPKLDIDGLRWAPRSFLRSKIKGNRDEESKAVFIENSQAVTKIDEGLIVQCTGLIFHTGSRIIAQNIFVRSEERIGVCYHLKMKPESGPGKIPYEYGRDGTVKSYGFSPSLFDSNGRAAFLRGRIIKTQIEDENDPTWRLGVGLLLAVKEERYGIIFGRILGYAQWYFHDISFAFKHGVFNSKVDFGKERASGNPFIISERV